MYKKFIPKKKLIISAIACVSTALLTLLIILLIKNKNYTLPVNTYFLNYDLSGMKKEEVVDLVENEINPSWENEKINVTFNDETLELDMKDYNFKIDANEFFNLAKKSSSKKDNTILPKVKFSKDELLKDLEDFKEKTRVEPIKYSYQRAKGNTLKISAGEEGEQINVQTTFENLVTNLQNLKFEDIEADKDIISDDETAINLEKIKDDIDCEVKDASYEINNAGTMVYHQEQIGMELNLEKANKIIEDRESGSYTVPITIIQPKKTVEKLKREHDSCSTPTVLSQYTTKFSNNPNQAGRNFNIQKSALSVNNIVLYPGEQFSFKNAVCPTGRLIGYKDAKVFTSQGVGEGNGGGICQVSSTVYGAATKAHMTITERHPHSQQVLYVPIGQDAAFDSNGANLRFKNSRKDPVRIVLSFTDTSVTCAIKGTKRADENFEVTVTSEVVSKSPNQINAVAHKTVKKDGVVVSTETIPSSYKIFPKH